MKYYRFFPYIVLFFISISLSGCFSPHIERTETNELEPYIEDAPHYYKIVYVHMKDSSIIDLWGRNPKYLKKYKDMDNVIIYDNGITKGFISVKDISFVVIERSSVNAGQTVAVVGAVIASAAALIAWLYLIGWGNMH